MRTVWQASYDLSCIRRLSTNERAHTGRGAGVWSRGRLGVLPVCARARVSAFDECIQLNRFLMSSSIIAVLFFCKQETIVKL